jgi:hypothetical protein
MASDGSALPSMTRSEVDIDVSPLATNLGGDERQAGLCVTQLEASVLRVGVKQRHASERRRLKDEADTCGDVPTLDLAHGDGADADTLSQLGERPSALNAGQANPRT